MKIFVKALKKMINPLRVNLNNSFVENNCSPKKQADLFNVQRTFGWKTAGRSSLRSSVAVSHAWRTSLYTLERMRVKKEKAS